MSGLCVLGDQLSLVYQGEELAAAFLGALMDEVSARLKLKKEPCHSTQSLMDDWELNLPTDPNRSSRNECFAMVKIEAESRLSQNMEELLELRPQSPKSNTDHNSDSTWHQKLFSKFCADSVKRLSSELQRFGQDTFVLGFDECSELSAVNIAYNFPPNRAPLWDMSLIALLRIIKAQDRFDSSGVTFWYPLLDTASSIYALHPFGPNAPSFRLTKALTPLPPWLYLGFNQMAPDKSVISAKTARQLIAIEHLKMYGRPVS